MRPKSSPPRIPIRSLKLPCSSKVLISSPRRKIFHALVVQYLAFLIHHPKHRKTLAISGHIISVKSLSHPVFGEKSAEPTEQRASAQVIPLRGLQDILAYILDFSLFLAHFALRPIQGLTLPINGSYSLPKVGTMTILDKPIRKANALPALFGYPNRASRYKHFNFVASPRVNVAIEVITTA